MRDKSQETLVGVVRRHVSSWRKAEGWSREAVVQQIVEAHDGLNGPAVTGIVFDPTTRDLFERQKVNADRIFRWLDDESKDNNLLPANFIHSILSAMPMDIRLHCIGDILRPLGITVASSELGDHGEFDAQNHLREMVKESAEAALALINISPLSTVQQLEDAYKEVGDVHEASSRARRALAKAIEKIRAGASRVRNFGRTKHG